MKFYKAGRRIRDINELETGKLYSICGVVGELQAVPMVENGFTYSFYSDEGIRIQLGREALMDRIHLAMVYTIKNEFHPREKTMAKLYSSIKK